MVEVRSRIVYTGRSTMHIVNEVLSADPRDGIFSRACDCLVIFVAMGEDRKSQPVTPYVPETEEEKRVQEAAISRIDLRKAIEAEMTAQTYSSDTGAPVITHRFLAKPTDVNWGGNVHGGTAMEWIDEAATSVTMAWSGERTVAVYAGGIRFYRPVHIGDLVEVTARLVRTDARTMGVIIHLRAGDPRKGSENLPLAIHASMTYVAVDPDGKALPARPFTPETEEDRALHQHALRLRELHAEYEPMPLVAPDPKQVRYAG